MPFAREAPIVTVRRNKYGEAQSCSVEGVELQNVFSVNAISEATQLPKVEIIFYAKVVYEEIEE